MGNISHWNSFLDGVIEPPRMMIRMKTQNKERLLGGESVKVAQLSEKTFNERKTTNSAAAAA